MTDQTFSQRYGTRRPKTGLIQDELTNGLVHGLINIVDVLLSQWHAQNSDSVIRGTYKAVDHRIDWNANSIGELIEALDWDEYCDACEALYRLIERHGGKPDRDRFSNELNALFGRQYFGYQVRNGKVEMVGTAAHEASIAQARAVLMDDDMAGPDKQFQKASEFFNRRPRPDSENCVKEAVGAVEGTARVLLGDDNVLLPAALDQIAKEKGIHPTLVASLKKYYAYRGDADGVTHGMTEEEVRSEDAEFVMSLAASAIVYLARLYGRDIQPSSQIPKQKP